MTLNGYFIQYKFILPTSVKHSSYTYQKLFRAIYGYTQNVCKSNGKTYRYHRPGILSNTPYIRPGKNCVIIPQTAFQQLSGFFKTGKNPSHYWQIKGDWKAVYYMDEKKLEEAEVITALENQLSRNHTLSSSGDSFPIEGALEKGLAAAKKPNAKENPVTKLLLSEAEAIVTNPWFRACHAKSPRLSKFYKNYRALKP